MKSTVPHIVQYQGSKRKFADQILKHMPRRFDRLIEPFAGMAAVSIAVAYRNMTDNFIINDINPDIVSILQSAIESPEDLILSYSELWNDQFTYSEGSEAHFYQGTGRLQQRRQESVCNALFACQMRKRFSKVQFVGRIQSVSRQKT